MPVPPSGGRHRRARGSRRSYSALVVAAVFVLVAILAGPVLLRALDRDEGAPSATPSSRPSASTSREPGSTDSPDPTPAGTSGAPTPSESSSPEPLGTLLIHGVGDVNVDPTWVDTFPAQGYDYAWSGLDGLFQRDDLTVINLECAISELGSPVPKEFNFRCDPEAIDEMKDAGIEVASLGNNHAYDFGPDAIPDSRKNLEDGGILPVGAGKDQAEALSPALLEIKGWKIAVVGIDQVLDPLDAVATPDKPGTAAGHDRDQMVQAIEAAAEVADLVIVTIHWGVELDTEPRDYMIDDADLFIEAGADIIFGHHSHRVNPVDMVDGTAVFWGLGHFVWPHLNEESAQTAVAEVIVHPNGKMDARIIPAYIQDHGHPILLEE